MIDSSDSLVEEFVKREMFDIAKMCVGIMIFDTYYTFNKLDWVNQENIEYRDRTEMRFSEYYKKRKKMWDEISNEEKMRLSDSIRQKSIMEGMMMENITLDDWLKKIESL
jgi:hypothetical protein